MKICANVIASLVLACTAVPAYAEDTPADTKAAIDAQTAVIKAQQDKITQLIGPLQLLAGKGTVTPGSAGVFEANVLADIALKKIAENFKAVGSSIPVDKDSNRSDTLVLATDEHFNPNTAALFGLQRAELIAAYAQIEKQGKNTCHVGSPKSRSQIRTAIASDPGSTGIAVLGAVASLFQTDITLTPIAVTPSAKRLADLVAGDLKARRYDAFALQRGDPMMQEIEVLDAAQRRARTAGAGCAAIVETARTPSQSSVLETLTKIDTTYQAMMTSLTTADAEGRMPIIDVAIARVLGANFWTLRIGIANAGGNVIQIKNLLTSFGANPLTLTSGLSGTARLSKSNGFILKNLIVTCVGTSPMLKALKGELTDKMDCK